MFEYDFENNNYNIYEEAKRAQEDGEVALWFTRHMPIDKLTEAFVKAWNEKMDEIEKR